PAGTGVKQYRDIEVFATAAPAPHLRSLREMAEEDYEGMGINELFGDATSRSLSDLATADEEFGNEGFTILPEGEL
ncbi:MAG: hypothetical protein C4320_02575, partial [Armatimonadota bacterium]